MKKNYRQVCPVCWNSLTTKEKIVICDRCNNIMNITNEWLDPKDITKLSRVRGFKDIK